jgi:hypothetical protein
MHVDKELKKDFWFFVFGTVFEKGKNCVKKHQN